MTPHAFTHRRETQPAVGNVGCLRINVTLQAKESTLAAQKQHPADTSMRGVASDATFNFHGSVLEDKWPSLFGMAVDAAFPIGLTKHWLVPRPVRAVAVRTFHQTFGNTMVAR